jgi:hypothetical protein
MMKAQTGRHFYRKPSSKSRRSPRGYVRQAVVDESYFNPFNHNRSNRGK